MIVDLSFFFFIFLWRFAQSFTSLLWVSITNLWDSATLRLGGMVEVSLVRAARSYVVEPRVPDALLASSLKNHAIAQRFLPEDSGMGR